MKKHVKKREMLKREKPKGAKLAVTGLPSSKKSKRNDFKLSITPFIKLKGIERDRIILECAVSTLFARNALKGVLIGAEEIKTSINEISDLIRDDNFVNFDYIKKVYKEEAHLQYLKVYEQKKNTKWMCSTCRNY